MAGKGISGEASGHDALTGNITAKDVARLRAEIFSNGHVWRAEAERLLAMDGKATATCMEWTVFLVEAISDYLVHQEVPTGHVSDANAAWLIEAAASARPTAELEVLVAVLERATTSPASLAAHALERVADAVVEGALRMPDGRALVAGIIDKPEVDLLRRILHAFGGGAGIGISREEALRHETFLDDTATDVAGFLRAMASAGAKGILAAYRAPSGLEAAWERRNTERAAADAHAEVIDAQEAVWLVDRIMRDRTIYDNEKALLSFIGRESPLIHPAIRDLIDKVA